LKEVLILDNVGNFKIETFPLSRISTYDIGQVGLRKHHMKALIELDVTEARKMVAEKRKLSKEISFNSWLIKCISNVVKEYPLLHGIRKGKRKVVLFDDIDISIMIEREIQGKKAPLPYVIRRTNEKSISDIWKEIKNGQKQMIDNEGNYVLGETKNEMLMKLYYMMPGFIRRIIWRGIIRNPFMTKQNMGTVMITFIGTVGQINGWVIPVSVHPICFAIGSIIKKHSTTDNGMETREYLKMTILVDHDVIDGAPAARALSRLIKMVESGFGLF
jgi:pyruvate/2-oxoglutarate dehydrogenase complex dihydrolipoamide acyltransferase (E2) component